MQPSIKHWQKTILIIGLSCLIFVTVIIVALTLYNLASNPHLLSNNVFAFNDIQGTETQTILAQGNIIGTASPTIQRQTETPFQPFPSTNTPFPTVTPTLIPTSTSIPPSITPTNSPTPVTIPKEAFIPGIIGFPQTLNLSCESRSAVDLAGYYGISINELTFLYKLPESDNPNKGFVGNANGNLGQLPPASYGVHAKPVAKLLREYGLNVGARKNMTLDELKFEISRGRPVIIWAITGLGISTPVTYTSSDGETSTVARYEHTVIVIGYDEFSVTVLDGNLVYQKTTDEFLASWKILENMAVVIRK